MEQHDDDRTHFDLREFYWEKAAQEWELRVGVNKVFWGVTESVHLVDVINQTDFIEDIDTEDKLGQPMLNFALVRDWGTLDFFALFGFRERTFPGRDGRLRGPIPVDTDNPDFESDQDEWHTDWAVRWSRTMGDWDLGLSYFYGTARDPRLELRTNAAMQTVLTPVYDLIHQGGIDAQWIVGGWAWKFEGIVREGQGNAFSAVAAGFEYTLYGVFGSVVDVGLLAEYLGDTRGSGGPSPTDNDVFVGTRFGFNDVQNTAVLAGAIVDLETGAAFWNLEASRRLGESWTIEVQGRAFSDIPPEDPTFAIRRDDYVEVELAYHF